MTATAAIAANRRPSGNLTGGSAVADVIGGPQYVLPNGLRLSCGALKKDSFLNLRAPAASSAGWAPRPPTSFVTTVGTHKRHRGTTPLTPGAVVGADERRSRRGQSRTTRLAARPHL